jgi:hypothetical protein
MSACTSLKDRHHDEWDRPVEPLDPYGPGNEIVDDVTDHTKLVTGKGDDVTDE